MKKFITAFLFLVVGSQLIKASDYIDTNIVVNAKSHKLLLCTPSGYDSSKDYPLVIGLHYCTSTAQVYRDALRKMSDSLNLIIACPDNFASEITDNDINMLQITIDTVKSFLNINEDEIFLTGMSCNGKVTLKHGLKGTYKFKGIFPWVPWITNSDIPKFDLSSKVPVTVAVGTTDTNYGAIINLYDSLKNHGANVNLVVVPKIGHIVSFPTFADEMIRSINYINDTNAIAVSSVPDIAITDSETKAMMHKIKIHKSIDSLKFLVYTTSSNVTVTDVSVVYNQDSTEADLSYNVVGVAGKSPKGFVVVEAFDPNGSAIEQTTYKVDMKVGIATTKNISGIYPNPASEYLKIAGDNRLINYSVVDLEGRTILQASNVNSSQNIDISSLSKGVYYIHIQNNSEKSSFAFVVK